MFQERTVPVAQQHEHEAGLMMALRCGEQKVSLASTRSLPQAQLQDQTVEPITLTPRDHYAGETIGSGATSASRNSGPFALPTSPGAQYSSKDLMTQHARPSLQTLSARSITDCTRTEGAREYITPHRTQINYQERQMATRRAQPFQSTESAQITSPVDNRELALHPAVNAIHHVPNGRDPNHWVSSKALPVGQATSDPVEQDSLDLMFIPHYTSKGLIDILNRGNLLRLFPQIPSLRYITSEDMEWVPHCDGPTLSSDPPYPGAPAVQSFLRNFWVTTGRKGTLRSDLGKQEEEPEKNGTLREKKTASGAEKETVTDPRTAREQEDIGTTSSHPREGRTRRQYPKTPATLWEERGLRRCVGRVEQNKGGKEESKEGR
ncbi:hypothetical protein NDU88_000375 [Pleurodeles waltl]|uniref:Uncharacterized protein n=1 Tax=Pleurodeles waltl TaxID=8319 RepID=A0AAV7UPT3_PLEWA|nr:hypothetical protein NDU88_000375 [Pleurodeles waltl]